jgi:hypothetical protein
LARRVVRRRRAPTVGREADLTLAQSSALPMAVLMQAFGHAGARLLEGAVLQQARAAINAETCAALHRLDLTGVGPMVLARAAERIALARVLIALPAMLRLLACEKKTRSGSSQPIALYRLTNKSARSSAERRERGTEWTAVAATPVGNSDRQSDRLEEPRIVDEIQPSQTPGEIEDGDSHSRQRPDYRLCHTGQRQGSR